MRKPHLLAVAALATLAAFPRASAANTRVADITHVDGARTNVLTGMGLVIGLNGKGDGAAYLPAIQPLAQLLRRYGNGQDANALLGSGANVALVMVTATVPANGTRNGAALNIRVSSIGAATDLHGGTLFPTPLVDVTGRPRKFFDPVTKTEVEGPWAVAHGDVHVEDDSVKTGGVVEGGAVMEADLVPQTVDEHGQFTLVLNDPDATAANAEAIAKAINEEMAGDGDAVALAVDPKNVLVRVPVPERGRANRFVANVQQLQVRLGPTEKRVRINSKTGTMVISGDVEIYPAVITQSGLTISTVVPPPNPNLPHAVTRLAAGVDTTGTGGAKLQDLAAAFDQLKVPVADRIEIVKQLYEMGKLHVKLEIDGQDK